MNVELLLLHASLHVPFWQSRLQSFDLTRTSLEQEALTEMFARIPICTKNDLREGFPDSVTSSGPKNEWRYGSSAGTIDRVTIVTDFKKRDYLRAANLRVMNKLVGNPTGARIVEVPPDACNVVCALRDEGPVELLPFIRWAMRKGILFNRETRPDLRGRLERSFIIKQETLEPLATASYENLNAQLDQQLDRIQKVRPNILRGLPLFLLWLAERARERNLTFGYLKAITPYGGLTGTSIAKRVSIAFGAPFVDYYGTSEVGPIAIQTENSQQAAANAMSVFDDLVLVEVLDELNRPLSAGKVGKIVITDYHNYAMPLIRYEIGDCGCWISTERETSDQFYLSRNAFLQVVGRKTEVMQLPGEKWVTARDVLDVLFADPTLLNARLEQRPGRNGKAEFTLSHMSRGELDVSTKKRLQELMELDEPFAFRRVSYLRPESSGKFRIFKPLLELVV